MRLLTYRLSLFFLAFIQVSFLFYTENIAYSQKLQNENSLSPAERKYRQYCLKKEECKLYTDIRSSFGSASANDKDLINKIQNCENELNKTAESLKTLLKKEKKLAPLDMCK